MFKWQKRGLIWKPSKSYDWMQEYGQNPNAVELEDRIRIYFSSRKKDNADGKYLSFIFFVDVNKSDPSRIIDVHDQPLLNPFGKGENGAFDEFGTMPGSIVYHKEKQEHWLYYVGWQRPLSLPYSWANGLAISKDGGASFQKIAKEPIISSRYEYPYLHACPRVFRDEKDQWFMWYASGVEWHQHEGRLNPIYVLMGATSEDGIQWNLSGKQSIPSVGTKECQSSASVIRHDGKYHMFFSYRDVLPATPEQKQYRIGYAWSNDLANWHRDDSRAGISVSPTGWDSTAVCYPHVVKVEQKIYMFYSGSEYGSGGFGFAELKN